jgi:hypothetical protein
MATEDKTLEDEVKNPAALLAKNKELLKELSDTKAALQASQASLEKAQGDQKAIRDRWYQIAVLDPLETDLRGASAAPWKYLKDMTMELGLLKMQPDAEGFERPTWFNEKGEPADLTGGLYRFLSDVYKRTGNELGSCLRSSGISGSGATAATRSASERSETTSPIQTPAPAYQLGLR